MEKWYLTCLINKGTQVQVLSPLQKGCDGSLHDIEREKESREGVVVQPSLTTKPRGLFY